MTWPVEYLGGRVALYGGDCLELLPTLAENSVDSVVCDPPYHLTSIVKRFGSDGAVPATDGVYGRSSAGFMGRKWDAPDTPAINPEFANWLAGFVDGEGCFHVHKKTVNGCETYDCQFSITLRGDDKPIIIEIQRQLGGIGSVSDRPGRGGNPQVRYCVSSKADCQKLAAIFETFPLRAKKSRDFELWCLALEAWVKHEPGSGWDDISYYRKAIMAVRQYGSAFQASQIFHYRWAREVLRVLKPGGYLLAFASTRGFGRMSVAIEDAGFITHPLIAWVFASGFPKATRIKAEGYEGFRYGGQALKPAIEPIYMGQKPFSEDTGTANILRHGTGAVNIDACRVGAERPASHSDAGKFKAWKETDGSPRSDSNVADHRTDIGRWPANLIHDGSEEVLAAFPEAPGQQREVNDTFAAKIGTAVYGDYGPRPTAAPRDGGGSAARFFYSSKADADDRLGSKHPTVKPLDLMQYLVRLVTPPGGVVLDPFAGTGTTGEAAWREGMRALLIEREAEYQADIARRMELAELPTKRSAVAKSKNNLQGAEGTPLFGSLA